MADVIQLLHELRDMFEAENVPIVVQKIDEALKQPQMKIGTPKGDLVVEIAQNETLQASVCLENETLGPVELFMAEVLNLGFNPYFLSYERPLGLNKGKSRWTFKKKMRAALDSIFSNSTFPLRLISYLGIIISLLSFMAIVLYLYIYICGNKEFWGYMVPGWTSLVLLMFMLGGLVLLSLGVISEYLWRIYDEVKNRPGYIIKKKNNYIL